MVTIIIKAFHISSGNKIYGVRTQKLLLMYVPENYWSGHNECEDIVKTGWNTPYQGSHMHCAWQKIKGCKKVLCQWSRNKSFNSRIQIEQLQFRIKQLVQTPELACKEEIRDLEDRLVHAWGLEEPYWK